MSRNPLSLENQSRYLVLESLHGSAVVGLEIDTDWKSYFKHIANSGIRKGIGIETAQAFMLWQTDIRYISCISVNIEKGLPLVHLHTMTSPRIWLVHGVMCQCVCATY